MFDGRDLANYVADLRLGVTYTLGLTPRHAIKINFFDGAYTRIDRDVLSIGISYNVVCSRGS